jgi:hypothetical protein
MIIFLDIMHRLICSVLLGCTYRVLYTSGVRLAVNCPTKYAFYLKTEFGLRNVVSIKPKKKKKKKIVKLSLYQAVKAHRVVKR